MCGGRGEVRGYGGVVGLRLGWGPGWGEVRVSWGGRWGDEGGSISLLTEAKQRGTVHRSVPQVYILFLFGITFKTLDPVIRLDDGLSEGVNHDLVSCPATSTSPFISK